MADAARIEKSTGLAGALPRPITSFVGREREIAEIGALLDRPEVRLLTLTGPGGVGKTRLAIEVARGLAPDFADGVAFVSLSSVRDPALAPAAVARAVDVHESESLAERLPDQHFLMLIDNVEHLLDRFPIWLAELLAGCPRLKVLATSRAGLNISGEYRYLVSPLPVPEAEARFDQPLTGAVTLFAQRAAAMRPSFSVTDRNIGAIAAICRAVDGLPLAIELAASRSAMLTPDEIASHLSDRLRLLAGGRRDAPERMRSLRATMDWSYELLSLEERALFCQLAVFVGRFDLAAAGAVIEMEGIALFTAIAALVDKSLVQVAVSEGSGEVRYFLLDTLRDYGLERLVTSGEEAATRERHATWYIDQAAAIAPWLEKGEPGVLDSVGRLDEEYGNLRAALTWLAESGRGAELAQAAMRLRTFWYLTERHAEALHWYERSVPTDDATRIEVLRMTGQMASLVGRADAAQLLQASLALAQRAGDRQQEARGRFHLALIGEDRGDFEPASFEFGRARELFAGVGNEVAVLQCDYHLGIIAYGQGRLEEAERLLRDTIDKAERTGDQTLPAWCATYLMLAACERKQLASALTALENSPMPLGEPALRHHVPDFLATVAVIASFQERHDLAARLLGAARRNGVLFKLPERLAFERAEIAARQALGDAGFERQQAIGRRLAVAELEVEIDRVAAGRELFAPTVANGIPVLSDRELDVLRLIVTGLTNREIADALYISRRTVATHVDHILTKLDLHSRTAAVAWAIRNGMV